MNQAKHYHQHMFRQLLKDKTMKNILYFFLLFASFTPIHINEIPNVPNNYILYNYYYQYDLWEDFSFQCEPFILPEDIPKKRIKSIFRYEIRSTNFLLDTNIDRTFRISFDSCGRVSSLFHKYRDHINCDATFEHDTLVDGKPRYGYSFNRSSGLFYKYVIEYDENGLYDVENSGHFSNWLEFDDNNNLKSINYYKINECGKKSESGSYQLKFFGLYKTYSIDQIFKYDSLCRLKFSIYYKTIIDGMQEARYYKYNKDGKLSNYYIIYDSLEYLADDIIPKSSVVFKIEYNEVGLPKEIYNESIPELKTIFHYTFWK